MSRKSCLFVLAFTILAIFFSLSHAETFTVKRVIDGDTLLLTNGERVRLIGVDTPETKHPQKPVQKFGREAYLSVKKVLEGRSILNLIGLADEETLYRGFDFNCFPIKRENGE